MLVFHPTSLIVNLINGYVSPLSCKIYNLTLRNILIRLLQKFLALGRFLFGMILQLNWVFPDIEKTPGFISNWFAGGCDFPIAFAKSITSKKAPTNSVVVFMSLFTRVGGFKSFYLGIAANRMHILPSEVLRIRPRDSCKFERSNYQIHEFNKYVFDYSLQLLGNFGTR